MASSKDHYDSLLADHYTWMLGPLEDRVAAEVSRLRPWLPQDGGQAVDLGAGSGLHTLALARMGYDVVAFEQSARMAAELAERTAGLPVRCVEGDLRRFRDHEPGPVAVVTCMGDTLTHLPSLPDVDDLFAAVHAALRPGGILALTFRDLSRPLDGLDRFIPVRADADRIMTCFLEDAGAQVRVHDLIHVRHGDAWRLHKSCYEKLRLDLATVTGLLRTHGFAIAHGANDAGLVTVVASRR